MNEARPPSGKTAYLYACFFVSSAHLRFFLLADGLLSCEPVRGTLDFARRSAVSLLLTVKEDVRRTVLEEWCRCTSCTANISVCTVRGGSASRSGPIAVVFGGVSILLLCSSVTLRWLFVLKIAPVNLSHRLSGVPRISPL